MLAVLLLRCTPAQPFVKVGEARATRAIWSRRHWLKLRGTAQDRNIDDVEREWGGVFHSPAEDVGQSASRN